MKLLVDGKRTEVKVHWETKEKIAKVVFFGFAVPSTTFALGAVAQHFIEAKSE
jgi:hypothetical protein